LVRKNRKNEGIPKVDFLKTIHQTDIFA